MNQARLKILSTDLKSPLLIKKKENLFYLTGRSFDSRAEEYLLVKKHEIIGFGSGLEQIDWIAKSDSIKNIAKYLKGCKNLDLEYKFTYGEGEYIKSKTKALKLKAGPAKSPVDAMRQIKEPGEIALVKKSMQIVERVFFEVKKKLRGRDRSRPAPTEIGLAQFIQKRGRELGANNISFPAIVASGTNAAIPHHVPSSKKLKAGESIILDFGFKYKNYCSDFTRTVFLKTVPKKLEIAYNQVELSYNGSIDYINVEQFSGVPAKAGDVYQKSVDILAEKHLDKYFIHSLGHGTGLEIHELPNLSPNSKDVLKDGMVFSIEPGVYFPKLGGIRIEDLVYLEDGKVKKFINVPTALENNIF